MVSAPATPQVIYAAAAHIQGVTAAGGWTAWSERTGTKWHLVLRSPQGTVSTPSLRPRSVAFDASLGVSTGVKVLVAYSRCAHEPHKAHGGGAIAWYSARGCSVHIFDPAGGHDRTLSRTAGSQADVLPAVSGGKVAYAAFAKRGHRASIVTRALHGRRAHVVRTGRADHFRSDEVDAPRGPEAVALDAGRVAFLWDVVGSSGGIQWPATDLYVVSRRGRVADVDSEGAPEDQTCTGYTAFVSLAVAGGTATAGVISDAGWELERTVLDQPKRVTNGHHRATFQYAPGSADNRRLPLLAVDGQRLVLTAPAHPGTEVGASPLPAFGSKTTLDNPYGC